MFRFDVVQHCLGAAFGRREMWEMFDTGNLLHDHDDDLPGARCSNLEVNKQRYRRSIININDGGLMLVSHDNHQITIK